MKYDRIVFGYHGCDAVVAEAILKGGPFRASQNSYDWLGTGVYFWEFGPDRAYKFAQSKFETPAVVGAIIQAGSCFDLMDTRHTQELAVAYQRLVEERGEASLPRNAGRHGKAHHLDCAVLNFTFRLYAELGQKYDCARAAFVEGDPVYAGSAIHKDTHIQLVVRNPACILGVFRPTI